MCRKSKRSRRKRVWARMGMHLSAATACGQRNKVREAALSPRRYKPNARDQANFAGHSLAENGKEEITNQSGAFLMMKIDSQQLAPRIQPRAALTSDSLVFFGATGDL